MITQVSNTISTLKNLWIELFLDKTNKVTNVADGSVLNAVAFGTAKVAQKRSKILLSQKQRYSQKQLQENISINQRHFLGLVQEKVLLVHLLM